MKTTIKMSTDFGTEKTNLLKTIYLIVKKRYYYDRTKQRFFCDT